MINGVRSTAPLADHAPAARCARRVSRSLLASASAYACPHAGPAVPRPRPRSSHPRSLSRLPLLSSSWAVGFVLIRILPSPYFLYKIFSGSYVEFNRFDFLLANLLMPIPFLLNAFWCRSAARVVLQQTDRKTGIGSEIGRHMGVMWGVGVKRFTRAWFMSLRVRSR